MTENTDFIKFSDIQPTEVSWLYYPYIAKGKITILCGDPGVGKTTFILSLIAKLTNGEYMPFTNNKNEPIKILFQSAEDDNADTTLPRLINMGAALDMISSFKGKMKFSCFDENLKQEIVKQNIKLIVFDPLQAFLGDVNISSANEVRSVMQNLTDFAEKSGCAVVLIGHLNKNTNGINALYRSLGSIDIVAAARSVLMVTANPDDPETKIMIQIKNNLAPCGKSIIFDLENGAVKWIGLSDIKATDLSGNNTVTDFKNACDLLTEILQNDDAPSKEIFDLAIRNGIGMTTLKKAKSYLGVQSVKKGKTWYYKKIESSESGDKP